jgi:hypothetical protein
MVANHGSISRGQAITLLVPALKFVSVADRRFELAVWLPALHARDLVSPAWKPWDSLTLLYRCEEALPAWNFSTGVALLWCAWMCYYNQCPCVTERTS